jgi:branched-chain amino acid transport system ATP-binding protein
MLELRQVTAGYNGRSVLSDVSLRVNAGEVVAVVGRNGSGKSTLLKAVAGFANVTAGSVFIGDKDVTSLRPEARARMGLGYVMQHGSTFRSMSVREHFELGGHALSDASAFRHQFDFALGAFPQLGDMMDRPVAELSGGLQRMTGIATVLMTRPTLALLDEPSLGLSPAMLSAMTRALKLLAEAGLVVVIAEQKPLSVFPVCTGAHLLADGKLRLSGTPAELLGNALFRRVYLGESEPGGMQTAEETECPVCQ